jgi:hypothetical protein
MCQISPRRGGVPGQDGLAHYSFINLILKDFYSSFGSLARCLHLSG